MHTFNTRAAPGFVVNHNGDFSGDVIIKYFARQAHSIELPTEDNEITVPFELLKQLVAEYVRVYRISALEEADTVELLGVDD